MSLQGGANETLSTGAAAEPAALPTMQSEARSFIGTPYVLGARVKGAGCDCATLIAECLIAAGFAERESLGVYTLDWDKHTSEARYLVGLRKHVTAKMESIAYRNPIKPISPGDIVLVKVNSDKWNHGGIVTEWPMLVHAVKPAVEEVDASRHPMWAFQEIAVFTPGAKAE